MDKIHLFEAIREMKRISKDDGDFSFSFVKYDKQRKKGGDIAHFTRARLRPKPMDSQVENSSYKLFFTDILTGTALNCWEILIIKFNGKKTFL